MTDDDVVCQYCGCVAGDHASISIPLGSATCLNGCGCPLISEHVIKLFGG
jgi:hypothetical protein